MQYLGEISKMTEWSVCFQGKPFNTAVIQVYALTANAEEVELEWFYEDLQDLLELTPKKGVIFIIGDWIAKVGSQEIHGVIGKFGLGVQNEAGKRLTEFCQESSVVIANTLFQQRKRWLYTWTSPKYWLYSLQLKMEKIYTVSRNKTWSCLWLRPSALYCRQVKLLTRVRLFVTPWTVAH